MERRVDAQRRKTAVAWLSVASNLALTTGKLVVGLLIGSVSVMSEAIHSGMDLVASVIALYAVRSSQKRADEQHPFGHGKIENLSGTAEAILIFVAAGWIIYEAIDKLLEPQPLEAAGLGMLIMLVSSAVNIVVARLLFRVGRETDSIALQADGWHLWTDVYTSAGVMAGLGIIALAQRAYPRANVMWIDPVAAIAVAVMILRAAWHLTLESGRDLLDASLPPKETTWIADRLREFGPAVHGFHHLRTRKAGPRRFVEFHLVVHEDLSVAAAHRISDELTNTIKDRFPGATTTIHVEPCDGSCRPACLEGCLLTAQRRAEIQAQHGRTGTPSQLPG